MSVEILGHPCEPDTFTYSQTTTGPNGFRRVIRSYVAFDSRWPWWRRVLANILNHREPAHDQ